MPHVRGRFNRKFRFRLVSVALSRSVSRDHDLMRLGMCAHMQVDAPLEGYGTGTRDR